MTAFLVAAVAAGITPWRVFTVTDPSTDQRIFVQQGLFRVCFTVAHRAGHGQPQTCMGIKRTYTVGGSPGVVQSAPASEWSMLQAAASLELLSVLLSAAGLSCSVYGAVAELRQRRRPFTTCTNAGVLFAVGGAVLGAVAGVLFGVVMQQHSNQWGGAFAIAAVSWVLMLVAGVVLQSMKQRSSVAGPAQLQSPSRRRQHSKYKRARRLDTLLPAAGTPYSTNDEREDGDVEDVD